MISCSTMDLSADPLSMLMDGLIMAYKFDGVFLGSVLLCAAAAFAAGAIITQDNKRSAPTPKVEQEQPANGLNCSTVKIIYPNIDRNETLLEKVGEGPQLRMLRQGLFGSVGDVFKFCEKAE